MKRILLALVLGASMTAVPAWACDGNKEAKAAPVKETGKTLTLSGTVSREGCPMAARKAGCTGCVLSVADGGKKYLILKDDKGEDLAAAIKNHGKVELEGAVVEQDGKTFVRVKSYKLVTQKTS